MRSFFIKIAAILMTFVVLFSTMSFSISEHYCGEHLVDSALFSKAESCGMASDNYRKQTPNKDCSFQKDNCCDDIIKQIEGQNELKTNISNLTFEQQLFVASFVYSYINLFEGLETNVVPFKDYSHPLLVCNLQITYQVFII
ncbi:HYC_CC_PP family protein [Lutibacter sp.]